MSRYRRPYYTPPPQVLRRKRTQLDNIALVPASELQNLDHWEHISQSLPSGDMLVVTGSDKLRLQEVERQLDRVMRSRGHRARLATLPK
jgi:hypothetical protein